MADWGIRITPAALRERLLDARIVDVDVVTVGGERNHFGIGRITLSNGVCIEWDDEWATVREGDAPDGIYRPEKLNG